MCPCGSLPVPCLVVVCLLSQAHFTSVFFETELIASAGNGDQLSYRTLDFGPETSTHLTDRNYIHKSVCPEKHGITFEHHLYTHVTRYRASSQSSLKLYNEQDMRMPLGLTKFSCLVWCTFMLRFMPG